MPAHRKYFTEADRIAAQRESYKRYNASEKRVKVKKEFNERHEDNLEMKERYSVKRQDWLDSQPQEKKDEYHRRSVENRKSNHKLDPRRSMLADAKKRAENKGLDYDLVMEDIVIPEICPVLGIDLFVLGGKRTPNSPSLDRVDNSKGYTKDNVSVISLRANMLKNDAQIWELEAIVKYMEDHLGLVLY